MNKNTEAVKSTASRLLVTTSQHIHSGLTTAHIMWDVNIALLPAIAMSVVNFGTRALAVIAISILGAVIAEIGIQKLFMKKLSTVSDGSAVVTGLLLALCLPAAIPLWVAFIGGFIAIALGKQVYGGLGQNIFNPAHVSRAILLGSWPVFMTTWLKPETLLYGQSATDAMTSATSADSITCATPLGILKAVSKDTELLKDLAEKGTSMISHVLSTLNVTFNDLFLGVKFSGSIGEMSKAALLLGGIFLLIRGHITWHSPVAMCTTVFAGAWLFGGTFEYALFHLLTGGLLIGAIFMVTDMVTSPITFRGQLIFGFGCGALTLLIRMKGGYPEGVCYSILIMNAFVPLIDKFVRPHKFGQVAEVKI